MSLNANDSDRLVKNKINGFLIGLFDKLLQIKPKLAYQTGMGNGGGGSKMRPNDSTMMMVQNDSHA